MKGCDMGQSLPSRRSGRDGVYPATSCRRIAALLALALAGCGGGAGRPVAVEGQVMVGGKPLRLGSGSVGKVWFVPDPTRGNATGAGAVGDIDEEGKYQLFAGGKKGVPAGWYQVSVVANERIDPHHPKRPRRLLVPQRATSAATSGLSVEVAAGRPTGSYDLNLTR